MITAAPQSQQRHFSRDRRAHRRVLYSLGLFCALGHVACGQKGPPLAPIVYLPRAVTELTAKRVEGEVVLQFKVPNANTDGTSPADLERVEVWAHTGPLPAPADFLKYGTLVRSIEIKQPPPPPPPVKEDKNDKKEDTGATAPAADTTLKPTSAAPAPAAGAAAKPEPPAPETAAKPEPATPAARDTTAKPEPATPAADTAAKPEPATPAADTAAKPEPPPEIAAKPQPASVADTPAPAAAAEVAAPQPTVHDIPPTGAFVEQGWGVILREPLTAAHMEIGAMPPTRPLVPVAGAPQAATLETPETVNFPLPLARYYTLFGVSESRGRRGPHAGPIRVPLISPLDSPGQVATSYTADGILLFWPDQPEVITPPVAAAGATGALTGPTPAQGPASDQETDGTYEIYAAIETEGTIDAPIAAVATTAKPQPPATPRFGYNVYEVPAPDASTSAAGAATADKPVAPNAAVSATAVVSSVNPNAPLNTALLTTPTFKDSRIEFGTRRCYVVRRVEMAGTIPIEGPPSPAACVTPLDTFPPAPPASLAHVASGNAVSLIWEASPDADLAGYLVLRAEAPGDKLAPLTDVPITDASYVDSSVRRNRSYVYEVVAVDKNGNQSAPSNRVEETIR